MSKRILILVFGIIYGFISGVTLSGYLYHGLVGTREIVVKGNLIIIICTVLFPLLFYWFNERFGK